MGAITVWKDRAAIDTSLLFQGVLLYITSTYVCNIMFCNVGKETGSQVYITFGDGPYYERMFFRHDDNENCFIYSSVIPHLMLEYSDPSLFDKLDELLNDRPKRTY